LFSALPFTVVDSPKPLTVRKIFGHLNPPLSVRASTRGGGMPLNQARDRGRGETRGLGESPRLTITASPRQPLRTPLELEFDGIAGGDGDRGAALWGKDCCWLHIMVGVTHV